MNELNRDCLICCSKNIKHYGITQCLESEVPAGANRNRHLFRCQQCGSINIEPVPTEQELTVYYENYARAYIGTNSWSRRTVVPVILQLSKRLTGKNVLDIGCGYGDLLTLLPSRLAKFGVEVSEYAAAAARSKCIETLNSSWDLAEFDKNFDLVIALDFLEHLTNPTAAFKKIAASLNSDGYLVIETGNATSWVAGILRETWGYVNIFGHVVVLTPEALKNLAQQNRIEVIEIINSAHFQAPVRQIIGRGCLAYSFKIIKLFDPLYKLLFGDNVLSRFLAKRSYIPAPLTDHMIFVGRKI